MAGQKRNLAAPAHSVDLATQCGTAVRIQRSAAAAPAAPAARVVPQRTAIADHHPLRRDQRADGPLLAKVQCLKEAHYWGRIQLDDDTQMCWFCPASTAKR